MICIRNNDVILHYSFIVVLLFNTNRVKKGFDMDFSLNTNLLITIFYFNLVLIITKFVDF